MFVKRELSHGLLTWVFQTQDYIELSFIQDSEPQNGKVTRGTQLSQRAREFEREGADGKVWKRDDGEVWKGHGEELRITTAEKHKYRTNNWEIEN